MVLLVSRIQRKEKKRSSERKESFYLKKENNKMYVQKTIIPLIKTNISAFKVTIKKVANYIAPVVKVCGICVSLYCLILVIGLVLLVLADFGFFDSLVLSTEVTVEENIYATLDEEVRVLKQERMDFRTAREATSLKARQKEDFLFF